MSTTNFQEASLEKKRAELQRARTDFTNKVFSMRIVDGGSWAVGAVERLSETVEVFLSLETKRLTELGQLFSKYSGSAKLSEYSFSDVFIPDEYGSGGTLVRSVRYKVEFLRR